jgi:hypothetical protein
MYRWWFDHKRSRMVGLVQDKVTLSAAPVANTGVFFEEEPK